MLKFQDLWKRTIRLTDERQNHLESDHPEMQDQIYRISETLVNPDKIIRSMTDSQIELFYKFYQATPVTTKFLCIVVKVLLNDNFIVTSYFTNTTKKGEILWEKK
jgi:hypothetical protein